MAALPSPVHDPVTRARDGDREAFAGLVQQYERGVRGLLSAHGIDPDEREDLVQEVFLEAYRGLARLREPERFTSWLRGIAIRQARLARRRFGVWRRRIADAGATRPVTDGRGPDEELERREKETRVREGMAALPERQREILHLHIQEGMPFAGIARLLEIPPTTVKREAGKGAEALQRTLSTLLGGDR